MKLQYTEQQRAADVDQTFQDESPSIDGFPLGNNSTDGLVSRPSVAAMMTFCEVIIGKVEGEMLDYSSEVGYRWKWVCGG